MPSRITINYPQKSYVGKLFVYLNGTFNSTMEKNDVLHLDVDQGTWKIKLKVEAFSSVTDLQVNRNEIKNLEVALAMPLARLIVLLAIIPISAGLALLSLYSLVVTGAVVLYLIYVFAIKKRPYISLTPKVG